MGQIQSQESAAMSSPATPTSQPSNSTASATPASSMESLIAEAAAYGNDENESLEAKAQKALDCPCIADLRSGPCGDQFSEAFLCFLKSTAEEKGSDCVPPFVALQKCIQSNPEAFPKDILEDDANNEVKPAEEYKIIPPVWSNEPRVPGPKL